MRKNYFEILKDTSVNPVVELNKLQGLLKEKFWGEHYPESVYELISNNFKEYKHRGHILSLDELLETIFAIPMTEEERLFCFSEMYLDLLSTLPYKKSITLIRQVHCIEEQIERTVNLLGHKVIYIDNKRIIIEDNVFANESAQVVTEFADEKEALSILEYNHFSNKGNIERKKEILKKIADLLEPWRKPLNKSNELKALLKVNHDKIQALEKLFYMYNKFNIRHNNEEQMLTELSGQEIESWYDKVYTLSLFIILGKDVGSILSDFEASFGDNK